MSITIRGQNSILLIHYITVTYYSHKNFAGTTLEFSSLCSRSCCMLSSMYVRMLYFAVEENQSEWLKQSPVWQSFHKLNKQGLIQTTVHAFFILFWFLLKIGLLIPPCSSLSRLCKFEKYSLTLCFKISNDGGNKLCFISGKDEVFKRSILSRSKNTYAIWL